MPRAKISEFSTTPGDNTDIDGINIAEGCAPSGINDAIRELMAQLKDFQSGAAGDNITVVGTLAAKGTSSSGADLKLYEDTDNGTNYVGFIAPASIASNVQWTLPSADGSSGQALQTNGSGTLSFATLGISAGGTGQTTANAAFNALAPSQTGNSGRYLTTDGTNTSWAVNPLGTVTSVAMSVPSFLSVAGSPITSSGTLAVSLSGTALPTTNGGTGLTSFTANGVVYASSTSALTTGSALTFDGTTLGVTRASAGTSASFAAGGQTLKIYGDSTSVSVGAGGALAYGTTATFYDPTNLAQIYTVNGSEQMRLTSTGLGIGTSLPATKLHVASAGSVSARVENTSGTGAAFLQVKNTAGSTYLGQDATGGYLLTDYAAPLLFYTNNTERMRLDSSGNLGLGVTPSAWAAYKAFQIGLDGSLFADSGSSEIAVGQNVRYDGSFKYITTQAAARYRVYNGTHSWFTAASGTAGNAISFTQAMDLANSSGASTLTVNSAINTASAVRLTTNGGLTAGMFLAAPTADHSLGFQTAGSERARITSDGDLLVGATSASNNERLNVTKANNVFLSRFINTQASGTDVYGIYVHYPNLSPNSTISQFLRCDDNAATRAEIRSNGGIANYSGNNVNLSDRREKTNFAPAKSYLDTICAIPVQTFNYIDQSESDPGLTLGVVAQDVQAVAPELVMESNWGTEDDPKMRLSIYQTDLQYALMKCIQELKSELDSVKAELATLKGA